MRKLVILFLAFVCTANVALAQKNNSVTPETALQSYLTMEITSFKWQVQDKKDAEGVTLYRLIFTSQTWRDIVWKHELTVMVPDDLKYKDALLFITGGSVKNGEPNIHNWDKDEIVMFSNIAKTNKAITAIVWQIPNQPLFNDLTEDEIISYTFHNFQEDSDYTWPLLFPMVKKCHSCHGCSAGICKTKLKNKRKRFCGFRGFQTWLDHLAYRRQR